MCTVSYIGDQWSRTIPERYPWATSDTIAWYQMGVSQEEFNKLRDEVRELRELLKAAKIFDEATGQPDCEVDEKVELIRRIAKLVDVDVDEVFGKPETRDTVEVTAI